MEKAATPAAPQTPQDPPRKTAPEGWTRRVGVEIEYGGPDCAAVADLIRELWGGRVAVRGQHSVEVLETEFGDFRIELDWSAAHMAEGLPTEAERDLGDRLKAGLATVIGSLGTLFMPFEVAAPPIPYDRLGVFDRLTEGLRALGASDTRSDPTHAYALQLNPEIASREPADLLALLRAYLLESEGLRQAIGVDFTRRLIQLCARFPVAYRRLVLDPGYAPDLPGLIADYVAANPSRNRELDLLPLFAWLEPERLGALVDLRHVKARPTYHWRLPNCLLNDPAWSVTREWNRWVGVERLAADPAAISERAAAELGLPDVLRPAKAGET